MKWLFNPVTVVGILLAVLAAITGVVGYVQLHGTFDFVTFLNDFYANLSAELGSIAITVIVIDQLNRRRDDRRRVEDLKAQLLRQVRSPENSVAKHAIHEMAEHGWLEGENGMLKDAYLVSVNLQESSLSLANLQGSFLMGSNLQEATLFRSNLQRGNLWVSNLEGTILLDANLEEADLRQANLQRANLKKANLQGADLRRASLQGANLDGAIFDAKTILPDAPPEREKDQLTPDSYWTSETDMRRYTDPDHPNFWQPDWAKGSTE